MNADSDLAATVDRLVESNVIIVDEDDAVALSSAFEEAVAGYETSFRDRDAEALAGEFADVAAADEARQLGSIGEDDPAFVAGYRVLADSVDGLSHEARLQTVVSLDQIRGSPPRAEGAPDASLPVRGDRLETLLKLYPKVVLYVWKEDCDPCDTVRGDLDDIFAEPPDDLAFLSMYGPDDAEILSDLFDVPGAPTTLFIEDGSVVVRLYGAHHTGVYENEVHDLRHGPSPVEIDEVEVEPGSDPGS